MKLFAKFVCNEIREEQTQKVGKEQKIDAKRYENCYTRFVGKQISD